MLGKLFKHEFKSTYKVMCIIYAVMAAVTLLGMGFFSVCDITNTDTPSSMMVPIILYLVIYIISIFAFMIISYVYLALHFYKSMYSAQGYLTHTLPVKPLTTLHVKMVVSTLWLLLVSALTYLSVIGLIYSLFDPMIWRTVMPDALSEVETMFVSMYGIGVGEFAIILVLSTIISAILIVTMIAFACSIGQLFSRQKVVASVVAGIVLYFINQVIGNALSMGQLLNVDMTNATSISNIYGPTLWTSLIISAVYALICYIGSNIIVRKHINLE